MSGTLGMPEAELRELEEQMEEMRAKRNAEGESPIVDMTEVVRRMNQRILSGERANEDPIAREFMDAADFSIRYDLAHEKAFLKAIDEGFAAVGVVADGQGNFTIKIYGQEDVLIRGPGEEI